MRLSKHLTIYGSALSNFNPLEIFENKNTPTLSLLECKLETGRTHQIRVHLEHVGHPVVGDNLYGNKKSKLKRSFLHSSKLEFFHPMNNKKLYFESPLPLELKKFIETIS